MKLFKSFPLTASLVVVNVALWLLLSSGSLEQAASTVDKFSFAPNRLTTGLAQGDAAAVVTEVARSVSSIFIHEQDIWHVGVNMAVLAAFGFLLEKRLRLWKYATVYFASGLLTCAAYLAICPDGRASYGASSAVCGVLGAFIVPFLKERPLLTLLPITLLAFNIMGAMNPVAVAATGFAFWAHTIGYAAGALVVSILSLELRHKKAA